MKGVPHYTKDGKEYKGKTHKMKDGSLHTGATHKEFKTFMIYQNR